MGKVNLRKEARGRPCQVRLPGCDGGGETTVLAHYRMPGLCGVGMKPDDAIGAWCCASCHDLVDYRVKGWTKQMSSIDLKHAHAEGVMRTIAALRKEGLL